MKIVSNTLQLLLMKMSSLNLTLEDKVIFPKLCRMQEKKKKKKKEQRYFCKLYALIQAVYF